jgi:hypothetical protein
MRWTCQRSGSAGDSFRIEGVDQQPAGRFAAEDVLGGGPAAPFAGDRHNPAAQPGRPDVAPGPGTGWAVAVGGAGVAREIHGSGDGVAVWALGK